MAARLNGSLESRLVRVRDLYHTLLGRDPDPTGWAYWADSHHHIGDIKLAVTLAESAEYLQRSQLR